MPSAKSGLNVIDMKRVRERERAREREREMERECHRYVMIGLTQRHQDFYRHGIS